jgi:hypothetical protein
MEAIQSAIFITNSLLTLFLLIEIAFLLNCLRRIDLKLDVTHYKLSTTKNNNNTPTPSSQSGNIVRRSPVQIDEQTAYMIEKKNQRRPNPVL